MKRFVFAHSRAPLAAVAFAAASTVFAAPCWAQEDNRDPLEPVNRAVFQFNDTVDRAVLKPVALGYRAVLPELARDGVRNFFSNLRDPWTGVNQILQGKVHDGFSDLSRFLTNSTFGLAGLFDVASEAGIPKHDEDFGQTLGVWGLESGPFLVLPIFGPSSVRDASGRLVDSVGYLPFRGPGYVGTEDEIAWRNSLTALDIINTRANLLEASNVLEGAALDRYTFVRDAYLQRRRSQVHDGNAPAAKLSEAELQTEPARQPKIFTLEATQAEPVIPAELKLGAAVDTAGQL